MELKILSWNIWYDGDFAEISRFLREADADIVALQEVVPDDATRDTIGFMTSLGYHHVYAPVLTIADGRTMSNAIFSKYPIVSTETYILSEEKSRNALRADIQVQDTLLHVFTTHLAHTHQQPSAIQESQADTLIAALPKENTIVMGDMNATPDSITIQKMRAVMHDTEMRPLPTLNAHLFDCPDCDRTAIPTTRLDYIFVTPGMHTHDFHVHSSEGSDHLPVSVKLGGVISSLNSIGAIL